MYRVALCRLWLSAVLVGCHEDVGLESPDAGVEDDAALSLRIPAAPRVALRLGQPFGAELSATAPAYVLTFSLTASAVVSFRTEAQAGGPQVDTVITLSRIMPNGVPRVVGTSDDFDHTPLSGLDRNLSAASYELVVRGASLRSRGPFALTSRCSGAGCPAPRAECLFGEQFSDLRGNAQLSIDSETWITGEAQLTGPIQRDQVVLAVQQSAHTDVTTAADALGSVDRHEIRHMELREIDGTRLFTAYEYGAGDNSYGAIFVRDSLMLAASIHDGDLLDCTTTRKQ